jgi:hypothetical protein
MNALTPEAEKLAWRVGSLLRTFILEALESRPQVADTYLAQIARRVTAEALFFAHAMAVDPESIPDESVLERAAGISAQRILNEVLGAQTLN